MGILSQDLDKTAQRFIREAIYGLIASQSVMLTEIGRRLESNIILKKMEERFGRQLIKAIWLAYSCKLPHRKSIVKIIDGEDVLINLSFGHMKVQLPEMDTPLNMVVVRGIGEQPWMLLTTLEIGSTQKDIWFIVQAYLKRWSVEETIRFIKQTYDLENIRVLRYTRLQNMMALLLAVFYFAAVVLDQNQKLTIMTGYILKSAKRVFVIPDFRYYALGDGLSNIFSRFPGKLHVQPEIPQIQLSFGFG